MSAQTLSHKNGFQRVALTLACLLTFPRAEVGGRVVFEDARSCPTDALGGCWAPLYPCAWRGRAQCMGDVCRCKEGYCASNGRCEWKARCHGSSELVATNAGALRNVSVELATTATTTMLCPKHTSGGCGILKDCEWRERALCVNETCTCKRDYCTGDGDYCEYAPRGLAAQAAPTTTTSQTTTPWPVTTQGGCGVLRTCQWRRRASCVQGHCQCHEGYFSAGEYCEALDLDCLRGVELPATAARPWSAWSPWSAVALVAAAALGARIRRRSRVPSSASVGLLSSA